MGGVFRHKIADIKAVDGVSFDIKEGEILGLVGESGCGKTTIARCITLLYMPTAGEIIYRGNDVTKMKGKELKKFRREVSMIFQDPYLSLNPRLPIGEIVGEPLEIHGIAKGKEKDKIVMSLLREVGLEEYHIYRYPFAFSGGQKQRIAIARALALTPKLIIADEPVSGLDVSIRASILNLLKELQRKHNLTMLFISHDLSVVKYMSERIAVMYLGKIVEIAESNKLFEKSLHPYTQALISAIPEPDPTIRKKEFIILKGEVPSPLNPPSGCRFHPRCPLAMPICSKEEPKLKEAENEHLAACHLAS
ncbi:ABC transporter ATP-binding protein [Candidatus Bathyarchaeota archaeon]|nr:ABC transporter ATP-binding protein [Candidatus Bathyarchaeota archaeon]